MGRRLKLGLGWVVLLALLLACARPPKTGLRRTAPSKVPLAVLVVGEVKGDQLGLPLRAPRGLAVATDGTFFVSDAANDRVLKFDSTLTAVAEIGGRGSGAGLLDGPGYMTLDNDLNLLVVDEGNRRVARFDGRLNYVDEILLADDEDLLKYGYPAGVAVSEFGEIWVTDGEKDRVAVFDHVGRIDRFVGDLGYSGGQLAAPAKIIRWVDGEMVICDVGNQRLVGYDDYGSQTKRVALEDLATPVAAAPDGSGFWIIDRDQAALQLRDEEGRLLYGAGPTLAGTSQRLRNPSDVARLSGDRLLLADTGNDRLLVCRLVYE